MEIGVVIPWRDSGDPERIDNYEYVWEYYENLFDWVASPDDGATSGPFNRSRAYNRGYQVMKQCPVDVILWNEADTVLLPENIEIAAKMALKRPGMVIPYTERHELSPEDTRSVLDGTTPFAYTGAVVHGDGWSIGQAGVTSHETMDTIGGWWDERFKGWGYDDNAMFEIFKRLAGEPRWVQGPGHHLYHTPAYEAHTPESRAATDANHELYESIRQMTDNELKEYMQDQFIEV